MVTSFTVFCFVMATSRSSVETTRLKKYKNVGQSVEEGRKKREEDGLHLRRQRREEQVWCSCLLLEL